MAALKVKPIRLGEHSWSGSEFAILKGTGSDLVIAGYASVGSGGHSGWSRAGSIHAAPIDVCQRLC